MFDNKLGFTKGCVRACLVAWGLWDESHLYAVEIRGRGVWTWSFVLIVVAGVYFDVVGYDFV